MAEESHLKRLASTSGIYAVAALAQRGLAFLLLPVYTRFIDPAEYGSLELLTAFSSIAFGFLVFGLPSAILKCYHRDAEDETERSKVLASATLLALPALAIGIGSLLIWAPTVSEWLLGSRESADLMRIIAATGFFTSIIGLVLSALRAEERAIAYSIVVLAQFLVAIGLNITFVVALSMGVRGVLIGNLISNIVALPLALLLVRGSASIKIDRKLLRPLAAFGVYLIPVMASGWIIDLSDRYVLRMFDGLTDVAVYGVGYKFGMIVQLAVVWPFQLAWPAFAFAISKEEGHRETYAQTLTYLTVVLAYLIVGLSLVTKVGLVLVAGENYSTSYAVVPLVALGYALNGVQYCVSPAVHVAEKTKFISYFSMLGAALNLGLNFIFIPWLGMMGAAITTAISFVVIATGTTWIAERHYAVGYQYRRLATATVLALVVYLAAGWLPSDGGWLGAASNLALAALGYPLLLVLFRFATPDEMRWLRESISTLLRRGDPEHGAAP